MSEMITLKEVKSVLTPQKVGFATTGPYPFTHTLSPYTGCAFGNTTCGLYCYAQYMPNWSYNADGAAWGSAVQVKVNAAQVLGKSLEEMGAGRRHGLRVFMASTTDPYQPVERTFGITRQCLEVFARYDDLDLLVVQTRASLVARDFDLIASIPYAWLSVTIETDDKEVLRRMRGGPPVAKRLALVRMAHERGLKTQVAVAPCLPHTEKFAEVLADSGADRVIVDTLVEGDGARGKRTARSPYPAFDPNWRDTRPARDLYRRLQALGIETGWSAAGFSGIPPRVSEPRLFKR